MKILLVQKLPYVPSLSGASKKNRILLELLTKRKHSCRVVALASFVSGPEGRSVLLEQLAAKRIRPTSSFAGVDVFHDNGVEVHVVSDQRQLGARLNDQIRAFDPTWTLISEDRSYLCLAAALEASPSRVVFISHSQATLPFGPESFMADPTKTELLRRTAGIVAVSNYLKDYIRRWGGLESTVIQFPRYGTGPFPRFGDFRKGFVTMVNPSAIKGIAIFLELARRLPHVQFAAVPTWATTDRNRFALTTCPNVSLLSPSENIDEIFSQTRILLCKPGIVYILDRAHGLHFFEVRSTPVFSWQDLFSALIERTEQMKTITNFPLLFLDLLETKGLLGQHLRDVNEIAVPLDLAVVAHTPNRGARTVLNGWNFPWVRTWRDTINTSRSLSSQRFMRTLPVILLQEKIKAVLLAPMSGLWRDWTAPLRLESFHRDLRGARSAVLVC